MAGESVVGSVMLREERNVGLIIWLVALLWLERTSKLGALEPLIEESIDRLID